MGVHDEQSLDIVWHGRPRSNEADGGRNPRSRCPRRPRSAPLWTRPEPAGLGTDHNPALAVRHHGHRLTGDPAPRLTATILAEVHQQRPDAALLGWWLADWVIAARLRWPFAVPLLVTQARGPAFRNPDGGGRISPGGEKFERAVCVALALAAADACRLAHNIAPRAARLQAATPKLRAKGAGAVVQLLLDHDAVSGTLQTEKLTRWGARRLFERLQAFDAVRELSGRSTFRLYGL